jgi:hypothetical protein
MVYPGEPENWPTGDAIVPINFPIRTPVSEINYGRSPALVRKISISFKVLDWPIPDIPPDYATPDDIAPLFLPPNGERPHTINRVGRMSKEEFEDICAGKKCFTIYGYVEYDDTIQKSSHRTQFCHTWYYRDGIRTYRPIGPKSYVDYT